MNDYFILVYYFILIVYFSFGGWFIAIYIFPNY